MIITDLAIRNRTTVYVLAAAMLVFGGYSYFAMPRESAPDVKIPFIIVTTTYNGVSPADIETSVTIPVENKLKSLRDVRKIKSSSAEGMSLISIEFDPTIEIDTALQKVRDKVDQARSEIPAEADDSSVREINISDFPIMMINVVGDAGLVRLKEIAKDIKDEIEAVSGVLEVGVRGAPEREIRIEIDPDRLAAYKIPVGQLIALVANENVNVSGGSVDMPEAKFQLRVPGEFVDPREIETLVVLTEGGKPIYLTDMAKIIDTFKDRDSYSRYNGRECVTVSVQKRAGENAIRIIDQIKGILDAWRAKLPAGVSIELSLDQSKDIRSMVDELNNSILTGFVLVAAVIFLVMGWRNAIFVSLAVPLSMFITFAVLHAMGVTLNFVTLFALLLVLGMLVDDAIVIVENIFRHMQEGHSRIKAAMIGASEVAWPVTTSTLTNVVAFLPLLFWPTIIGQFMGYLPKTVMIALLASLFVGLAVNPAICASIMKAPRQVDFDQRRRSFFMSLYERIVRVSLANRGVTIAAFVFVLVGIVPLYARYGNGVQFFPESDPNRAMINIKAPEGTSLDKVNDIARIVESRISGHKNVKRIVATVGAGAGAGFLSASSSGINTAQISIDFLDFADRVESSAVTTKRMRDAVLDIPGAEVTVEKEAHGPPTGAPVNIEVSGEDFDTLALVVREVEDRIKTIPGLVDLKDNYDEARPELRFVVDRNRAKLLGLDTNTIGFFLKTAVLGTKVGTFRQGNDEYDITLRLPLADRDEPEKITRLYVPTMTGEMIPVSSLVNVKYAGGLGSISRVGLKRVITVTGNNEGVLPDEILAKCRERLGSLPLPPGYAVSYTGQNEDMIESQKFLAKAFVVALFLIAAVLVAEFNSLTTMFVIMASVLFSLIGVFSGILLTGKPFGVIMTGIGVISLAGVVVKNAIVLLDYVERLRERGLDCGEALVRGGITRMRPVLLTAVTAILGLVPMATGIQFDFINFRPVFSSESSQWWSAMAVAVIFGLSVATVLTLVVVPVMYSVLDSAKKAAGHPWKPRNHDEK